MARRRLAAIDTAATAFDSAEAREDRHFVTALARGLDVLACFRKDEPLLGNQEIAARCGLPPSTVSRLTYTLTRLGYLHYLDHVGKYRLGTAVLALGATMLARLDVRSVARPFMQDLADFSRGSVGLGTRDRLSVLYVECAHGKAAISLTLDVGSRISIAASAMGRAFLAACREEERAPILQELAALDEVAWPRSRAGIDKAIRDQQELGCCCSFGEWQENVNAIAVGFRPGGGLPPMAMNCGGPATVLTPDFLLTEVRPRLIALVRRLDGAMGL